MEGVMKITAPYPIIYDTNNGFETQRL